MQQRSKIAGLPHLPARECIPIADRPPAVAFTRRTIHRSSGTRIPRECAAVRFRGAFHFRISKFVLG